VANPELLVLFTNKINGDVYIVDMPTLYWNKLNEKYSNIDILELSDLICKKTSFKVEEAEWKTGIVFH
jgi:hypothetical protein